MSLIPLLKKFYSYSPTLVKELFASSYGHYLNGWRYGKETQRLLEEAAERETWSWSQWQSYTENRLEYLLHRAANKVPYYKKMWADRRRNGDRASPAYIENWPLLTKEEVRQNNRAFLAEDCNPSKMYSEHTSGTSGKPIHVFWTRQTSREYYSLFEGRIRNWHGVSRNDRYAILGGQLVIPATQAIPPFWVRNAAMNQLYLSSYHLSANTIEAYVTAVWKYKPQYLLGYASSLYTLAYLADQSQLSCPNVKAAISNAEPLYDYQVKLISKVFHCPVVNTYGMSELVAAGCSFKDHEPMYLWPEVGILECLDFDTDKPASGTGRFIGTSLVNPDFCLIRYQVGDSGRLGRGQRFNLPIIEEIEGRIDDLVITKDGRRIGRLDPVFKGDFKLVEAQIVQETIDRFVVKIVAPTGGKHDYSPVVTSLRERVGDVRVDVEIVDHIEKGPNGKFKAVVSKVRHA